MAERRCRSGLRSRSISVFTDQSEEWIPRARRTTLRPFPFPRDSRSIDSLGSSCIPGVISFARSKRGGMSVKILSGPWIERLVIFALMGPMAEAALGQAAYPFRDPKLSDDQRIADLLGRLTVDEKINLMSDHPKIPRLGLVFSVTCSPKSAHNRIRNRILEEGRRCRRASTRRRR